jgi:aspartate/methionine/tyrosine aminotransferase
LSGARPIKIEAKVENNFMPTADEIRPYVKDATMIALCSPQNPTGTTFTKKALEEICDLVLEENERRGSNEKPLYVLYDQMYWILTYGDTIHYNPVSLRPDMRDYTVFIDGISKAFASTGLRVGWAFGPQYIIDKMKSILSHIGAWAPKPEQVAMVKVVHSEHASNNPKAFYKKRYTVDDVINSRIICKPLHLLDCCVETDNATCIIVTRAEHARDLRHTPALIRGGGFSRSPTITEARVAMPLRIALSPAIDRR